jgi:serine/threonine-protein kinase RsbW
MRYNLQVPCHKKKLKQIRTFIDEVLGRYRIPEVELNLLVLAVDEICANLIIHNEHHTAISDPACIELTVVVSEEQGITFEITDHNARHFNLDDYKEPVLEELIKARRKGGIGLMLVRRIMDKVEFETNKEGQVCRLHKKLKLESA